jgi:tetratricopeptide (TPR) repeat protein
MALSYWGRPETQYDLVPLLKPDPEDKHVDVRDMEAYAQDAGLGMVVRVNGSVDGLRELLRAGYPVIVASWHVRDAVDQLGHYRLVSGYDDELGQFILQDSLDGPDLPMGYRELDELWRVYNRMYVLAYPLENEREVAALVGADMDDLAMYERAAAQARLEAENPVDDCEVYANCEDWVTFAWFNVGSSLTSLGRHEEAVVAYDQARQLGLPFRMLWYQFGPYESYYAVGRHEDVIALADATLAVTDNLEESHYWRGLSRLALGDERGGRADLEAALRYHAGWPPAEAALAELDSSPAD